MPGISTGICTTNGKQKLRHIRDGVFGADGRIRTGDLFVFAQKDGWERALNQQYLSAISALLEDYKECLSRIRSCRVPLRNKQRKKDIDRILYSRGQEDIYDADELYALFQTLPAERISLLRLALREQA